MFDQIREPPKGPGVNRRALLLSVVVMLLGVMVIVYSSLWVLAKLGLDIGPDSLGPVEVWYDPYEDGSDAP